MFAGQEGLLYNLLLYQLGWKDEQGAPLSSLAGDHLRSFLCLLTCDSLLGDYRRAIPAAAAVELVHNYSLIHEDVQSGNPNMGHRPAVWWIWGPGQAINAGDGMHALARLTLMRLNHGGTHVSRVLKAMQLLDRACLRMCEGQHLDLAFQEKLDVRVGPYIEMAAGKTGALMSCAMGLGALAATEDEGVIGAFKECGERLGIACQIRGDLDELWQGPGQEATSANAVIKKKLFPIVFALETGDFRTKRELGTLYFKRVLEPPDVQQIISILEGMSAREYAEDKIRSYCRQAMDSLENVPLSTWGRGELEKVVTCVVTPDE